MKPIIMEEDFLNNLSNDPVEGILAITSNDLLCHII